MCMPTLTLSSFCLSARNHLIVPAGAFFFFFTHAHMLGDNRKNLPTLQGSLDMMTLLRENSRYVDTKELTLLSKHVLSKFSLVPPLI